VSWRQPITSHLIHPFLDRPHLPPQTASGSNQPFCHNSLLQTDRWGIRTLLRIPWTKLMTTAQVYKMAGTENELLNHIKSRKLRDEAATWQRWRQCGGRSRGRSEKPWKTMNVLVGQHSASGLVYRVITCYTLWETEGVGRHWLIHAANRCEATTARWHDMTWHDMAHHHHHHHHHHHLFAQ